MDPKSAKYGTWRPYANGQWQPGEYVPTFDSCPWSEDLASRVEGSEFVVYLGFGLRLGL